MEWVRLLTFAPDFRCGMHATVTGHTACAGIWVSDCTGQIQYRVLDPTDSRLLALSSHLQAAICHQSQRYAGGSMAS